MYYLNYCVNKKYINIYIYIHIILENYILSVRISSLAERVFRGSRSCCLSKRFEIRRKLWGLGMGFGPSKSYIHIYIIETGRHTHTQTDR